MVAINLSGPETYLEDTPLNLTDIVIADSGTATATLTLSNPAAGALTTGTSGVVTSTYDSATGVWSASGPIADVNALLAAVTFIPAENFNGDFFIATSVSDDAGTATGNKVMTGTAVNDAPVAFNDLVVGVEDTVITGAVLANDTDVENDPLSAALVSGPASGTLILNSNGTFSYTPNANFNGTDSFTYIANDGEANSNVATVSISINGTNSGLITSEPGPDFGHDVVDAADFVVWRKTINTDDPPPPDNPSAFGELVSEAASGDHGQPQLASTDLLELPPSPVEPGAIGDLVLEVVPPAIPGLEPGQPTEPPAGPPEVTPPTAPPGSAISSDVLAMVSAPDLGASAFVHTGLSPEAHGPA